MSSTPRLAFPLRFVDGRAVTVEQGTAEEVAQGAEIVLRTVAGERPGNPEFGRPELDFTLGGVDPTVLEQALERWSPRAAAEFVHDTSRMNELVDRVTVHLNEEADRG